MRIVVIDPTGVQPLSDSDASALREFVRAETTAQWHVVSSVEDLQKSDLRDVFGGAPASWAYSAEGSLRRSAWLATQLAGDVDASLILCVGWAACLTLSGNSTWFSRCVTILSDNDSVILGQNANWERVAAVFRKSALLCISHHLERREQFESLALPGRYVDGSGRLPESEALVWERVTGDGSARWTDLALLNCATALSIVAVAPRLEEEEVADTPDLISSPKCGTGPLVIESTDVVVLQVSQFGQLQGTEQVKRDAWRISKFLELWPAESVISSNPPLVRYAMGHPDLAAYFGLFLGPTSAGRGRFDLSAPELMVARSCPTLFVRDSVAVDDLERTFPEFGGRVTGLKGSDGDCFSGLGAYNELWGVRARTAVGGAKRPLRVVVAGHDLKFAKLLIRTLFRDSRFEVIADQWPSQHDGGGVDRAELLDWADVVWVEFASTAAIWYSHNVRDKARLIVRVHGYEVSGGWGDGIDFRSIETVIFVSESLKRRALHRWEVAVESCAVIPNAVDELSLARNKSPGSMFTLGLLGWTPGLKRPDLALALLELLRRRDPRFLLSVKGTLPSSDAWFLGSVEERELYFSVAETSTEGGPLAGSVIFEEAGPDVAQWLTTVGWVLSVSDHESFHLAPVEGMASGSIPVVLERDGADDVFTEEFVFADLESAATRISEVVSADTFADHSRTAIELSRAYGVITVREQWLQVIAAD